MAKNIHRVRRSSLVFTCLLVVGILGVFTKFESSVPPQSFETNAQSTSSVLSVNNSDFELATAVLETLTMKGRAPKTGYERSQFGSGWQSISGCDMRNRILARDLQDTTLVSGNLCLVASGLLSDPYTGKEIAFIRGSGTSSKVQIDHVVALSDAWQKGAQQLSLEKRQALANDPLELIAVDGAANMQKSDGDAATWLPANKPFRCQYVARQIAVKQKYSLWVTEAEKTAIKKVLSGCPGERLPKP